MSYVIISLFWYSPRRRDSTFHHPSPNFLVAARPSITLQKKVDKPYELARREDLSSL